MGRFVPPATLRSAEVRVVAASAMVAVLVACGGDEDAARDDAGRVVTGGDLSTLELRVGDCFVPPEDVESELSEVRAVPCEEPHRHEVYAMVQWTDGDLRPDDERLGTFADNECLDEFEPYVGRDYFDSSLVLTYLLPSIRSWNEVADRSIVCVARSGSELTRSVAGGGV